MLGGDVNDFYFELAVRVVEVCRGTRGENGGLIAVGECKERVQKGKGIGGGMEVSEYVICLPLYRCRLELIRTFLVMTSYAPSSPSSRLDQASPL